MKVKGVREFTVVMEKAQRRTDEVPECPTCGQRSRQPGSVLRTRRTQLERQVAKHWRAKRQQRLLLRTTVLALSQAV